jgi:acetylornithine deacetylase/succinyl-diaminopimelate desuccinylase-like protein
MFNAYLEQFEEPLLRRLADFVAIPSVSTSDADMRPAVDFLTGVLDDAGFSWTIVETARNPVVMAEIGPDGGEYDVLIYGHYDVFPADDADEWHTPPFVATRRGDRIYGRGTGDNKGQILAHIEAVRMLQELDIPLRGKVKLLIEGEEEIGSGSLPIVVREHRDRLRAAVCFYSDGPMFPDDQPIILFGVRGAVVLEFVARGANRVLHSGNFGGVAPAPALELARLMASLVAADGTFLAPGLEDGVPSVTEMETAAIARLPEADERFEADVGVPTQSRRFDQNFYERLLLRPYFNLAGFSAGWAGEGVRPIIPNEARAKVDIRLVGDQDPEHVINSIRDFMDMNGFGHIELRSIVAQPASKTRLDHPLVPAVKAAVTEGFGKEPMLVPGLGGTTPEYVFTKLLGMPAFCVPYAPSDESNHAPNECTKVSLFLAGIRTTASLLTNLTIPEHVGLDSTSTASTAS